MSTAVFMGPTYFTILYVANVSATACALTGFPIVEFDDQSNTPVSIGINPCTFPGYTQEYCPAVSLVTLLPTFAAEALMPDLPLGIGASFTLIYTTYQPGSGSAACRRADLLDATHIKLILPVEGDILPVTGTIAPHINYACGPIQVGPFHANM